jgi:hypothetical protein
MTTPAWQAPANGLPRDLDSTNTTTGINQLLGAHGIIPVYKGAQTLTPTGGQSFTWTNYGNTTDLSQPFTMSGTAVGRVTVPLQPNGNGADVLVSLYADNGSGSPNIAAGAIASTLLPAQYLAQVCAAQGLASGGPLASAGGNTLYATGGVTTAPWAPPAGDSAGVAVDSTFTVSGDYAIYVGGYNFTFSNEVATVATAQWLGGSSISPPIAQPPLPLAVSYSTATTTPTALVVMGGSLSASVVANVWVASWNPNTGVIGSWSAGANLPQALDRAVSASWGNTVYCIGGQNFASTTVYSTVYTATLNNGQLGSWSTSQPLPTPLADSNAAVIGNWLIVAGGYTNPATPVGLNVCYYAKINPDGSLGPWQTGPNLHTPVYSFAPGWNSFATDSQMVLISGDENGSSWSNDAQVLSVTSEGVADRWVTFAWPNQHDQTIAAFGNSDGTWAVLSPIVALSQVVAATFAAVPLVSVPLPATGLTNGATYHVVLRQFAPSSASDFTSFGTVDGSPLPATALTSSRYASGAWTSVGTGRGIPLSVFDQTPGGTLLHTWEDASSIDFAGTASHWSSLLFNSQQMLYGALEMTQQPNQALNANPTFTSGVSPWTATNGALTQSAAQTHGGFAFSGLLTPTGGFALAYAASELFPVVQTPYGSAQWVLPTGWFYTPTTWANFSLSVNWFDSSKAYLSTSSATRSLTGATWTQVTNFFQVPAAAAYVSIAPTLSGSPANTQLLYLSNVFQLLTPETVGSFTSAAQVTYGTAPWPPTGVTQLN